MYEQAMLNLFNRINHETKLIHRTSTVHVWLALKPQGAYYVFIEFCSYFKWWLQENKQ